MYLLYYLYSVQSNLHFLGYNLVSMFYLLITVYHYYFCISKLFNVIINYLNLL